MKATDIIMASVFGGGSGGGGTSGGVIVLNPDPVTFQLDMTCGAIYQAAVENKQIILKAPTSEHSVLICPVIGYRTDPMTSPQIYAFTFLNVGSETGYIEFIGAGADSYPEPAIT